MLMQQFFISICLWRVFSVRNKQNLACVVLELLINVQEKIDQINKYGLNIQTNHLITALKNRMVFKFD